MAASSEKTTYRFDVDYAKLSEGYRAIKREMSEAEKASKAVAKEQKRMAKEVADAQKAAARETHNEMERAWIRTKDAQRRWQRDSVREFKAAEKEYREGTGRIVDGWSSVGLKAGAAITAMMSASAVIGVLRDIQERFKGISESADATAKAMKPLSVQVAGKEGPAFTRDALAMGAAQGLTPEETGTLANTIKSIQGADFKKEFRTGAKLANLGVEGQDAAPIIQAGVVRGMGGQRAAELALTASDRAPWSVADVARVVPKTLGYSSLESGLAAGATLRTAGIPLEQMPASVEALLRVLTKDDTPLSKKFKLKGLGEAERIQKLSAAADASGNRAEFIRRMPEKYKLGEEESRALRAALSMGGDFYGQQEAALRGTQSGEMDRRFDAVMQDPLMKREYEGRRATAVSRAMAELGPMGDAAEQERARTQATGARLMGELPPEAAAAMTNDQGRANFLGRSWSALQNIGFGSGVAGAARFGSMPGSGGAFGFAAGQEFLPSVFGRAPGGDSTVARNDQTDAFLKALEENTKATMANTKATGGGDAVGAPIDRNAEL